MYIQRLTDLSHPEFPLLLQTSIAENFRFLQRLQEDWNSGENRFDKPGEIYLGVWEHDRLLGVGGLNEMAPGLGRVRRFYVLPEHRRTGVGRALLNAILEHARAGFHTLEVHTLEAAAFYEALGFTATGLDNPTHNLKL